VVVAFGTIQTKQSRQLKSLKVEFEELENDQINDYYVDI